ncbi:type II toxin-antitoxin system VapC family toxin [Cryptosporangium sp. NPDC051539]|uniref:type II toxin-antitoxin system VapC family toxin n=1 Tax=Cryptosporangium sp. NPDC051539 TaxID=3363962 RepID=UPI00379289CE
MSYVVLDTDVASAILRGRLSGPLATRLTGHDLAITFVTVAELERWRLVRDFGPRRTASLVSFYNQVVVLPYSRRVAETWGAVQAGAQLRGRPRPQNDTWIAACCLVHGVPLATFNTKDFAEFETHDGLEIWTGP